MGMERALTHTPMLRFRTVEVILLRAQVKIRDREGEEEKVRDSELDYRRP